MSPGESINEERLERRESFNLKPALKKWLREQNYYSGIKQEITKIIKQLEWETVVDQTEFNELTQLLLKYAKVADTLNYVTPENPESIRTRLDNLRSMILARYSEPNKL